MSANKHDIKQDIGKLKSFRQSQARQAPLHACATVTVYHIDSQKVAGDQLQAQQARQAVQLLHASTNATVRCIESEITEVYL